MIGLHRHTGGLRSLTAGVIALVLAASSAGTAPPSTSAAGSPLKIGAVLQISGTLAFYGQELGRGYDLGVQQINRTGGINGRKLVLEKVDAPTAADGLTAISQLHNDGVNVVIGTGSSDVALSGSSGAERDHMVWWETNGLASSITQRGYKYTVQDGPNTVSFVKPSIAVLKTMVPKILHTKNIAHLRVALVYSDDAYGTSNSSLQQLLLTQAGANIVLSQSYNKAASDLSSVVLRMKEAHPDVVLQTGYENDIVLIWRQAKELNYLPKLVISSGAAATTDFAKALGNVNADGFVAYSYAMPSKHVKGSQAFAKKYLQTYHTALPSGHALAAYSGMLALGDALRAAKGDNPDSVIKAAKKLNKAFGSFPDGCGLKLSSSNMNTRCDAHAFQWQNGTMRTIWPAKFSDARLRGPMIPWSKRHG